jgi:hypothetical protein
MTQEYMFIATADGEKRGPAVLTTANPEDPTSGIVIKLHPELKNLVVSGKRYFIKIQEVE